MLHPIDPIIMTNTQAKRYNKKRQSEAGKRQALIKKKYLAGELGSDQVAKLEAARLGVTFRTLQYDLQKVRKELRNV